MEQRVATEKPQFGQRQSTPRVICEVCVCGALQSAVPRSNALQRHTRAVYFYSNTWLHLSAGITVLATLKSYCYMTFVICFNRCHLLWLYTQRRHRTQSLRVRCTLYIWLNICTHRKCFSIYVPWCGPDSKKKVSKT